MCKVHMWICAADKSCFFFRSDTYYPHVHKMRQYQDKQHNLAAKDNSGLDITSSKNLDLQRQNNWLFFFYTCGSMVTRPPWARWSTSLTFKNKLLKFMGVVCVGMDLIVCV